MQASLTQHSNHIVIPIVFSSVARWPDFAFLTTGCAISEYLALKPAIAFTSTFENFDHSPSRMHPTGNGPQNIPGPK
ncbi:hypothetical protein PM082_004590 [Marasmius tenuissimus]|nr:hypothetical protein PM082_004590 [Marasmius tenuissimus]